MDAHFSWIVYVYNISFSTEISANRVIDVDISLYLLLSSTQNIIYIYIYSIQILFLV